MSILSDIRDGFSKMAAGLSDEVSRYKNANFLAAVTAGCAMVAFADGEVSSEEKQKMAKYIKNSEALKVFDFSQVMKAFSGHVEKLEFDREIGMGEALQVIGKLKGKPEARLLVRVCIAIGQSDGNFDPLEKKIVQTICKEVGVDPAEFDL